MSITKEIPKLLIVISTKKFYLEIVTSLIDINYNFVSLRLHFVSSLPQSTRGETLREDKECIPLYVGFTGLFFP